MACLGRPHPGRDLSGQACVLHSPEVQRPGADGMMHPIPGSHSPWDLLGSGELQVGGPEPTHRLCPWGKSRQAPCSSPY